MAELCQFKVEAKVASWPFSGPKIGQFGHMFEDMVFKFVLPTISIDKGQTKLEVNWTQINYLSLKKQKSPYLKIPFCPSVNHQKA